MDVMPDVAVEEPIVEVDDGVDGHVLHINATDWQGWKCSYLKEQYTQRRHARKRTWLRSDCYLFFSLFVN